LRITALFPTTITSFPFSSFILSPLSFETRPLLYPSLPVIRWLAAAARGEDIGIVCGAPDIVALRKVDVESTDYAQREYGALPEQVAALEKAIEQRYRRLKEGKKLKSITAQELRKMIE
jgi:hypothetical protein